MDYQMLNDSMIINNIMDMLYSIGPLSLIAGVIILIIFFINIKKKIGKILLVISIILIISGIAMNTIISSVMFN